MLDTLWKMLNPVSDYWVEPTWQDLIKEQAPAAVAAGGGLFGLWALIRSGKSLLSGVSAPSKPHHPSAQPLPMPDLPVPKTREELLQELIDTYAEKSDKVLIAKKAAIQGQLAGLPAGNAARDALALHIEAVDAVFNLKKMKLST